MLLSRKKLIVFLTIASFLFINLPYPMTAESAVAGLVVQNTIKKGVSYVVKVVIRNRKVIAEVVWEAGKWAVEEVIERADIELSEIADYFSGLSHEDICGKGVGVGAIVVGATVAIIAAPLSVPVSAAAIVGGAVYWLFSDSDEDDDK